MYNFNELENEINELFETNFVIANKSISYRDKMEFTKIMRGCRNVFAVELPDNIVKLLNNDKERLKKFRLFLDLLDELKDDSDSKRIVKDNLQPDFLSKEEFYENINEVISFSNKIKQLEKVEDAWKELVFENKGQFYFIVDKSKTASVETLRKAFRVVASTKIKLDTLLLQSEEDMSNLYSFVGDANTNSILNDIYDANEALMLIYLHQKSIVDFRINWVKDDSLGNEEFEAYYPEKTVEEMAKEVLFKLEAFKLNDFELLKQVYSLKPNFYQELESKYMPIDFNESDILEAAKKSGHFTKSLYNGHPIAYEIIDKVHENDLFYSNINVLKLVEKAKNSKVVLRIMNKFIDSLIDEASLNDVETEILKNIRSNNALLEDFLWEHTKMNLLNEKTFAKMLTVNKHDILNAAKNGFFPKELTPEEMLLIIKFDRIKTNIYVYLKEKELPLDKRIKAARVIPNELSSGKLIIEFGDFAERIYELADKEMLTKYHDSYPTLNKENAFYAYVQNINVGENAMSDDEFNTLIWAISKTKNKAITLEQAKDVYFENSSEIKDVKEFLDLSDGFTKTNRENLMKFVQDGTFEVVKTHYNNNHGANPNIQNIKVLAKAELANKLMDVIFTKTGLEAELEAPITENVLNVWKSFNTVPVKNQGGLFKVYENQNFKDYLMYGEKPTSSCMNYRDGSYRHCMLSIFDSNKKLIYVEKNGNIVARAIMRLTKTSATSLRKAFNVDTGLRFEDVDDNEEKQAKTQTGDLVIFVERLYSSVGLSDSYQIKKAILQLALEKAKKIGARVVIAKDYNEVASGEYAEKVTKNSHDYIFISRSKNSNQYLDSLGGDADEDSGGRFVKFSLTVLNPKE